MSKGKKILLISPARRRPPDEEFVFKMSFLNLPYLAAVTPVDYEVEIIDEEYEKIIFDADVWLVALTAQTPVSVRAYEVADAFRKLGVKTVMGGPHVSFCAHQTLRAYPQLDCVVLGEGDDTITELAQAVADDSDLGDIPGLAFRQGRKIHETKPRGYITDIDRLPMPARHLLPLGRYRALGMPISMTTSRGCPFKCIFCVGRKMVGAKVRYRDPLKVVDELAYLDRLGFHQINIADDLFTANKTHCLAVCDEIIRRGLKPKWTSFARVDTVSLDLLTRMQAAGCHAVSFGVESANARILKTIKKGITVEQVVEAVSLCNAAGVTPNASFILGLPGETPESLNETVAFGERLKKMGVQHGFHLLAPFPGTAVREQNQEYDLNILSHDWKDCHANRAICETSQVNRRQLDRIVKQWEQEFDKWLGLIEQRMASGDATEDEAWQLENLKRIVLIYDLMMQRTIERRGFIDDNAQIASPEAALEQLAARVAEEKNPQPLAEIYNTLKYALDKQHLALTRKDAGVQWQWVDYLY